jgi:hypothetical protein
MMGDEISSSEPDDHTRLLILQLKSH